MRRGKRSNNRSTRKVKRSPKHREIPDAVREEFNAREKFDDFEAREALKETNAQRKKL